MNRLFRRLVFGLSLGLLVVLLGGEFGLRAVRAGSDDKGAYRQIEVYSEVLKKIQTDYVTVPSVPDVTSGALHGLLESLDSNSSYLSPSEYKIYKERPSGGNAQVGMTISKRFGYAVVVSVLSDSPAAKGHFTDGDVIVAIDGHSTRELSPALLDVMLEGKPGTEVTLSVLRPRKTEPEKVALTRVAVQTPAMSTQQYEGDSILYLKPVVLTAARVDEIVAQIKAMGKSKDRKILLDLRDVSTGSADQGLRLANLFLKQGTMATLSGQKFPRQTFTADPKAFLTDAPLAVLVNRGTAGAAELTAAALGDNKRADVVGERTFGDESVQKTMELPDGAAVILTVATYASPSGKKIMEEAVTPTVVVGSAEDQDMDAETPAAPKTDEALDKALDLLKAKAA
uniref:Carboxyl-terminal protease n=1 Tax=mine drainage metagenome TaxID=410659 RepID=E6QKE1_9ZZZZ